MTAHDPAAGSGGWLRAALEAASRAEASRSWRADELLHTFCCDRGRALCGADVRGHGECPVDGSCGCAVDLAVCVVCDDLAGHPCRPRCPLSLPCQGRLLGGGS